MLRAHIIESKYYQSGPGTLIYIQEHFDDSESVTISVDGLLTRESVLPLRDVVIHHLEAGKTVSVNLKEVIYISREGKAVLREFEGKGILIY